MLDYIHEYPNPAVEEFNEGLILGTDDIPMTDMVMMVMKDFETVENIELIGVETVMDQDEVDLNHHVINVNFKKRTAITYPTNKFVADSRFGEMNFTYRITTNLHEQVITKRILIPIEENGFYYVNGKSMKAIWQLCDANTYTQRGKITLKSRMPIIVYQTRNRVVTDSSGRDWVLTSHSYALDTKSRRRGAKKKTKFINPMMIFAAKMGMSAAIDYFNMTGIIDLVEIIDSDTLNLYSYFPMDNVWIRVPTILMEKYDIVRHVVCMLVYCSNRDFPVEWKHLENRLYWTCRIGYIGSIKSKNLMSFADKGATTQILIERLYEPITKHNLRLPEVYKADIYTILYWMILNFDVLHAKNNLDCANKRLRKNEALVMASLGKKVSENINKLVEKMTKSKMNTMDTLLELFNFPSDIIMSGLKSNSDQVKSDDIVNDLSFISELSYTSKGFQALGLDTWSHLKILFDTNNKIRGV